MKHLAILAILCSSLFISCSVNAAGSGMIEAENRVVAPAAVLTPTPSITPPPQAARGLHSKIGIVDVDGDGSACLRTKNGNLAEQTPISIIIFPYDSPTQVLTATVKNKVDESCARRASESGDNNPGENYFYLLTINEKLPEFFAFEVGFGVIEPAQPVKIQKNLASIDLNEDGKPEYFRQCSGYEGTHFTIWAGKPLKGKRIWHSFYYVDYDTVADCKKKDWEMTED
jgi:hypothetical protein